MTARLQAARRGDRKTSQAGADLLAALSTLAGMYVCSDSSLIRTAAAAEVEVTASVTAQAYELRTADAGNAAASLVDRRRLTSYLGLHISGVGEKDPDGLPALRNQFAASLQLRFDSDLGEFLCSIGRTSIGAPLSCLGRDKGGISLSPELTNYKPEVLFGYVEGQNLAGFLDLRLGRQVQWELLDLRALDGLWLQARTPIYVALEAFAGLQVSGALPIDSPIYALDGTSRSPLITDDSKQQSQAFQPTFGFALRSHGLRDVQGRLSYRRTMSATQDRAAAGCQPEAVGPRNTGCAATSGIIEDHLAYTVHGRLLAGKLHGWGGLRYDFISSRFDEGSAGLRWFIKPRQSLLAEYHYSAPTFDADSIWSVFASEPYHEARAAYEGRMHSGFGDLPSKIGDLTLHAAGFVRVFHTSSPRPGTERPDGVTAWSPAYGGSLGLRLDRRLGLVRISAYADGGYGGLRVGGDVVGRLMLMRNTVGLEARAMYLYWADSQRIENNAHSASLQAGVYYALVRGVLLHLFAEDNINRFYRSQLRLMAMLDLSYFLGPHGGAGTPAGSLATGLGRFPAPQLMPGVFQ